MPSTHAWLCRLPLATLLLALCTPLMADPVSRVLYHLNDGDPMQQYRLLRNIVNHFDASPPDSLEIKVLVHGEGIGLLLLPEARQRVPKLNPNATPRNQTHIDNLRARGVTFMVSEATLKFYGIDPDADLYQVQRQDIVPNGLAYMTRLQTQGYTYIKP